MQAKKVSRREFLSEAGLLLGGFALGSIALANGCSSSGRKNTSPPATISQIPGVIYSPDTLRANRLPPGQVEFTTWPRLQSGGVPQISLSDWSFTISGKVDKEVTLNYADLTSLTSERVFSDIHCVTGWSLLGNLWEGFGSQTIAGLVNLKPDASFVIVSASGGYTTNLTLSDFLQTDVLFAINHDGAPLPAEHGGPVRLVVPRLYFWKSAKWVTGIDFTVQDQPGYWETRGYNNHGDPWLEERYSTDPKT
jgi:DMSO/TMAO reductase YedYZ molybdopterin-dependent catalytic subunit